MNSLRVSKQERPDQKDKLATSRKLGVFTDIGINDATKPMAEAVFRAFIEGQVRRSYINLTQIPNTIDTTLLSQAVTRVASCQIIGGKAAQLQAILTAVLQSEDLALKSLNMSTGQLAQVSADLVTGAAVKLNSFVGNFTAAHIGEILTRLATTAETKLRRFYIGMEYGTGPFGAKRDLSHLSPEIVGNAMVKMETLDLLSSVSLSPEQVAHLLSQFLDTDDLRCTDFHLHQLNLSLVPPAVMAGVVVRMEKLKVFYSPFTPEQLVATFTRLASQDPAVFKLKYLEFVGVDLTSLSPEIMAGTAMRVDTFAVGDQVTAAQIGEILTLLATSEDPKPKLKRLRVDGKKDLAHLPAGIVSEALPMLLNTRDLFHHVVLSPEQVVHLFAKIRDSEDPRVTKFDLRCFNISQVAPDLLAGVVSRVENVKFHQAAAPTRDQTNAIFTMLADQHGGLKLKDLQFEGGVDLRSVNPEVLVRAMPRLERMRFDEAKFTTDQLKAILVMVCEGRQGKLNTLWIEQSNVIKDIPVDLLQSAMKVGKKFLDIYPRPGCVNSDMDSDMETELGSEMDFEATLEQREQWKAELEQFKAEFGIF